MLTTINDVLPFRQILTKLFNEINLVNMLYDYYYQQWSITVKGIELKNFDVVFNSDILTKEDFHYIKELGDDKYYLCCSSGEFRFVKKILLGFRLYNLNIFDRKFERCDIVNMQMWYSYEAKFYEIPLDFYSTVLEELQKLDNSRCLLL